MTRTGLKRIIIALGAALLVCSSAAQETATPAQITASVAVQDKHEPATENEAAPDNDTLKTRKEKISYAFGVDMARTLRWQRIDVDPEVVIRAMRDGLAGKKLLMTEDDMATTLRTFQGERKQDLEHAKKMISERNKKEGEESFAANVKKDDVVTLPSGLQYKILKQGDGKKPALDDKVVCQYRGTLLDGKEFDSSYKHDKPTIVPVKGLIKGWSEALQLMPVGSKWQLFIPPQLGYGERVVGGIGPNSTLVFEVELISIEEKTQKVQDNAEGLVSKPQGSL
jgi:FKBP-type peptidyl-prolyl cis-trans isomerase FklB